MLKFTVCVCGIDSVFVLQQARAVLQLAACFLELNAYDIWYGMATISRLLRIIGLFCRILSLL